PASAPTTPRRSHPAISLAAVLPALRVSRPRSPLPGPPLPTARSPSLRWLPDIRSPLAPPPLLCLRRLTRRRPDPPHPSNGIDRRHFQSSWGSGCGRFERRVNEFLSPDNPSCGGPRDCWPNFAPHRNYAVGQRNDPCRSLPAYRLTES